MKLSRRRVVIGLGLAVLALSSPVWVFEGAYRYGIWGEALPDQLLPDPAIPPTVREALWVAAGETPGEGIEALWCGNYFRRMTAGAQPARGSAALGLVARRLVYRDPNRILRGLEHHLHTGAVAVWLSRHVSEADLKQHLAGSTYFGREAWGASDAAKAYFGRPVEDLTLGQLALLAGLPQAPGRDPTCHPEQAAKRRAYVLGRMRSAGVISSAQFESAAEEAIAVLPSGRPCRELLLRH